MKKRNKIIGIACGIVCCVMAISIAYSTNPFRSAGQKTAQKDDGKIAATVNDVPIYQSDITQIFEIRKAMAEGNRALISEMEMDEAAKAEVLAQIEVPTEEQIHKELIEKELMLQAAKEYGVTVSESEVDAYFQELEQNMDKLPAGEKDAIWSTIDDWREGRGMSKAEYDEVHRQTIRDGMILQKLQERVSESELQAFKDKAQITVY